MNHATAKARARTRTHLIKGHLQASIFDTQVKHFLSFKMSFGYSNNLNDTPGAKQDRSTVTQNVNQEPTPTHLPLTTSVQSVHLEPTKVQMILSA